MARICSIGFPMPEVSEISILKNQSLDDYDIVFFDPAAINSVLDNSKPLKFDNGSQALNEKASNMAHTYFTHWQNEINLALKGGKTIIIISSPNNSIKHAKRAKVGFARWDVTEQSIYDIFGLSELATDKLEGNNILAKQTCIKDIIRPLCAHITYSIVFKNVSDIGDIESVLETASGRSVGLFGMRGKGKILIIPRIKFNPNPFMEYSDEENKRAKVLIKMAVDLHNFKTDECELPPEWCCDNSYKTDAEKRLEAQLAEIDAQIEELYRSKQPIEQEKESSQALKQLLFGKGKALEGAVNAALNILGVSAQQYRFKNKDLEIDHLADLPDCTLIGECEGKDNKDIDKTKISQLLTNKGEYYDEPDINTEKPIKLVLFGNPMRLIKPDARNLDFTKACTDIAKNNQVSLVKTVDLFRVVAYVNDSGDKEFAKKCADAILKNVHGIVVFPEIPQK